MFLTQFPPTKEVLNRHAEYPTTTPAQPLPATNTPAEKLAKAGLLVSRAFCRADDESNDLLNWADRDTMCRQLADALRLM